MSPSQLANIDTPVGDATPDVGEVLSLARRAARLPASEKAYKNACQHRTEKSAFSDLVPALPLWYKTGIPHLHGWTQGREEPLMEEGTLSILRRGTTYQVRYASNNPYAPDRLPRACPDAAALGALLQHLGMEAETITQAWATVQHGGIAVFRVLVSPAQMQACFPPLPAPETSREADASAPG